jgi:LmbE family N-acetylglucosaminyl deacetylase
MNARTSEDIFLVDRPTRTLMIVHAHPDDEVIGSGGTLLRYAEEGLSTVLVCSTGGEEGEIVDPSYDQAEAKPHLGEIRRVELLAAAYILKIGSVELLGYRDSGMAGTAPNANAECFHQADLLEATGRLVHLIRRYRPHVLVSYNDFGSYGHPDHIQAHRVTHEAFDRAADPAFAPTPDVPPWQPLKLYEMAMVREQILIWARLRREEKEREAAEKAARDDEDGVTPTLEIETPANEEQADSFFQEMIKRSTPVADVTTNVDIARYWDKKREALRCHRTQIPADSSFFKPTPDIDPKLRDFEHFNLIRSVVPVSGREDDLFTGLR